MIRRIDIYVVALLAGMVLMFYSCLENDTPYPVIKLDITALEVDGQVGSAVISTEDRTVTVTLADTVNLKRVLIKRVEMSEGAKSILRPDTALDLTTPQTITLSLYQKYVWTIIGNQPIERRFVVEGQIGTSQFDVENRIAVANVSKDANFKKIHIKDLKLGPTGSTINGASQVMDFQGKTQKVLVMYKDKMEEWTLYVLPTDAVKISAADGWTNVAWLYGQGRDGVENGFEIREQSSAEWTKVEASDMVTTGASFSACVPHLKASTQYVCRAYSGEEVSEEMSLTTGVAVELPNASMDDWHLDGKVWCPWAEGGTPFWDSGNVGAAKAGKSNTTSTAETVDGTGKAAKLESINAVLKFAAGNLFVGKFVAVDGTNGILNFGQPFTARPTKLKGYYKYISAPINYVSSEGDVPWVQKGVPDTCSIYIALGDWPAPVEIRTRKSNRKLFDKNDSHVIAYAEMYQGTTVSDYTPFELKLDYRATNRVPSYIIVVASASKYGDYFVGGEGSALYLDNLSLEYDY